MKNNHILKFDENTELHIGDYFRIYKSKYFTLIKEIAYDQRDYEDGYGEYYTTMLKVDIFDKEENLLAENSIIPIDKLISGALAKYIPDLDYDPTYLGSGNPYKHYAEYKIWKDMTIRCFDCRDKVFPYIGGLGTTVCDRWRCFEYFLADFKHISGYAESKDEIYYNHPYIVDLYDIQRHIHPSNRIYAPGYVKLKPFKQSDICKYYNLPISNNDYPKDLITTTKYISGEISIKETLFKKQTGMNVKLDLNIINYYSGLNNAYSTPAARTIPSYVYNDINSARYFGIFPPVEMCKIVIKE